MIKEINADCYQCEVNDLCPAFAIYTDEQKKKPHPCCEVEVQEEEEQMEPETAIRKLEYMRGNTESLFGLGDINNGLAKKTKEMVEDMCNTAIHALKKQIKEER